MLLCSKRIGETTSEFASRVRIEHNIPETSKVAACGKLDPQARGITRILYGLHTRQMPQYLQSNKTYEFNIALGISTNSDDIMGNIINIRACTQTDIDQVLLYMETVIKKLTTQQYHHISAIKIRKRPGKKRPLWYWYKLGLLEDADIPSKAVSVKALHYYGQYDVSVSSYIDDVQKRLGQITNRDMFNIDTIESEWNTIQDTKEMDDTETIPLLKYSITVSSGFYVRMIAKQIRKELHIPLHIFDINRTHVYDTEASSDTGNT